MKKSADDMKPGKEKPNADAKPKQNGRNARDAPQKNDAGMQISAQCHILRCKHVKYDSNRYERYTCQN